MNKETQTSNSLTGFFRHKLRYGTNLHEMTYYL